MPDSKMLLEERLDYLDNHRALASAALSAVSIALSDPTMSKQACQDLLLLWQQRINGLADQRMRVLQRLETLVQGLPAAPGPLPPFISD